MAKGYGNYYQYGTSPRKIQPEYETKRKRQNIQTKNKNTKKQKSKQVKTRNKVQKAVKNKTIRAKVVVYVLLIFSALLVVSYRNSQITEKFTEVKNMKNDLAKVQKENEQLEASIESSINLKTIQQEAESQLGMKKLDGDQKVYISLPKKDYVEPTTEDISTSETKDNWFKTIINNILGK